MTQKNSLEEYLNMRIENLSGEWIKKNNAYEEGLCKSIGFINSSNRYWDAIWEHKYIELKKGKSVWLDLVRYGEQILGTNIDSKKEIITLFFIPNKNKTKIDKIIGISKESLFEFLKIDIVISQSLLMIQKILPRSFNAQASLTISDLETIADFIIIRGTTNLPKIKTNLEIELTVTGDQKFIIDSQNKLNSKIANLSKKLIANIRQWYDGELIYYTKRKRYIESPNNFWIVDIQPRNQRLKIIIYGKPERYQSNILDLKINFRIYSEFFISNEKELLEGIRIIKEAAKNKGAI